MVDTAFFRFLAVANEMAIGCPTCPEMMGWLRCRAGNILATQPKPFSDLTEKFLKASLAGSDK